MAATEQTAMIDSNTIFIMIDNENHTLYLSPSGSSMNLLDLLCKTPQGFASLIGV